MIATIGLRPTSVAITPPSGWTQVARYDNSGNSNTLIVYKTLLLDVHGARKGYGYDA
jgi:hypothetical protein